MLDSLESFRKIQKVSGQSGKFPDILESFWKIWKVSNQSGDARGKITKNIHQKSLQNQIIYLSQKRLLVIM